MNPISKSKKGAMEVSMGMLVTIVLVVVALVLGLVLVQTIFRSGTSAVEQIDSAVQDRISKLFTDEGREVVVYPASRDIKLEREDTPKGFAFSVKNKGIETESYSYEVKVADEEELKDKCGGSFSSEEAENYILGRTGEFSLERGSSLGTPRLVRWDLPETAPPCSIIYNLIVERGEGSDKTPVDNIDILVTIK